MQKILSFFAAVALAVIVGALVRSHWALWNARSQNDALERKVTELELQLGALREESMRQRIDRAAEQRELKKLRADLAGLQRQFIPTNSSTRVEQAAFDNTGLSGSSAGTASP